MDPTRSANEKGSRRLPPNTQMLTSTIQTRKLVRTVRLRVSLMLSLNVFSMLVLRRSLRFSRTRSKMTIVSLREYPTMVRTAARTVRSNSFLSAGTTFLFQ